MENSHRIAVTLLNVFLAGLLSIDTRICVAQRVTESEDGIVPYVLFSSYAFIHRMYPNGTGLQTLVRDPGGIIAMDYHYSMDCMFWGTTNIPSIKTASLNGSNITTLVDSRMSYPAGLAVDWINNKLYWTDRDLHHIEEYDLATSRRRVVLTTAANSKPVGIEVHPYPGFGWLYWIDRMLHTMSRASVVGNTSAVVMRTNLECGWPLTIDHRSGKVFWSDYCTYRIESLDIDGSNYSVVVDSNIQHIVLFSYGIAKYGNMLYWTQPTRIYSLDLKPGSPTTMLYTGSSSQPLRTLHVVHPSQQPSAEDLTGNDVCIPPCVNGRCITPGLCACNPGWTGLTCTTDVDECAQNNGDCEHVCTNSRGSYSCSCNDGFVVGNNDNDCETPRDNPTYPATTAIIYKSTTASLLGITSTPVVTSSTPALTSSLTSSSVQMLKASTHVQDSFQTRTVQRLPSRSVSSTSSSSLAGPTLTTLHSALPGVPSSSNAVLEPIVTPILPTEGVMNRTTNGLGLLIALVSVIGASVIIVVGVLYATLLLYKYRRRKRSWGPGFYDISSSGSSFRGLTARSPASTPSTGPSDASSRSSLTIHSRPPASISPIVIPTHSGASETQSCRSFELQWSDKCSVDMC